jgi:hypothetical protein
MTPESTDEARAGPAAFPGIADVTVIELDAGQCLIAYVVPSGPGLDVPELRAHARKTLLNGSMPAVIMVFDEISVTEVGTVKAVALPVPAACCRTRRPRPVARTVGPTTWLTRGSDQAKEWRK